MPEWREKTRYIARAGLLPNVNFNTSGYLYASRNAVGTVKFIANNAPHEYFSQGNVHQQLDLASMAAYREHGGAGSGGESAHKKLRRADWS